MNTLAPHLSGLDPFIGAFFIVAAIGAAISLVIIGEALATLRTTHNPARVARRAIVPA